MSENLGTMLGEVSRLLRRAFDGRARSISVTRPQWQVLITLSRHEGINQSGLADRLDVEPISLCRMVDRLQEADLVERRPDPGDRRAWLLYLTPKAHQLLGELRPLAESLMASALDGIPEAEQVRFRRTLDRVRQNLMRELTQDSPGKK